MAAIIGIGKKAQTPWQLNKSAKECNKYMLENELYADVTFLVGKDDKKAVQIKAHRYILISRSPAFEAMLCGKKKDGGPIKIPDADAKTFKNLLSYLYYGEFPGDPSSFLPLLYVAAKFQIPELEHKCGEKCADIISIENVCLILEQSLFYENANLTENCMAFIRVECKEILKQESFLEIQQRTLKYILDDDKLLITELEIFDCCITWGENQCKKAKKPPDGETIRAILGNALYSIRFPTMTSGALADRVASVNLLTQSEMLELLILAAGANLENKTKFKSTQRLGNRTVQYCERFTNFESTGSWSYVSGPDAIAFKTDKDIFFKGVKVFLSEDTTARYSIKVGLYHGKNCLKIVSCETSGGTQQKEVYFPDPIPLTKNSVYDVTLQMRGPSTLQGSWGKHTITSYGVKFNFLSSNMDENGTNVAIGQIPAILFTVPPFDS